MAKFKTMEQVLEAENAQLKARIKQMHIELLALVSRLYLAGDDPATRLQMTQEDSWCLHKAGLIVLEMYPDLPLPKQFRTPLPDCNEFTNDMAMAHLASQRQSTTEVGQHGKAKEATNSDGPGVRTEVDPQRLAGLHVPREV